jgi:hypothetical protein
MRVPHPLETSVVEQRVALEDQLSVKDFITHVFLKEYKQLLHSGFHYISFALLALGVEFLGACLDQHDFAKRNLSSARFLDAIKQLFPPKYQPFREALCDDLRNGFAHQLRPGSRFALTHRAESQQEGTVHLEALNNKTVLVAEDFYQDFEAACRRLIKMLDTKALNHPKLFAPFLKIT